MVKWSAIRPARTRGCCRSMLLLSQSYAIAHEFRLGCCWEDDCPPCAGFAAFYPARVHCEVRILLSHHSGFVNVRFAFRRSLTGTPAAVSAIGKRDADPWLDLSLCGRYRRPVKFAVLQFFSWPERRVDLATVYARALARIEVMDRNPYDAVWLAEHHFSASACARRCTWSACWRRHVPGGCASAPACR